MSRSAEVTLDFADGTYLFKLAWGQMIELQEKCDAGPLKILRGFDDGSWRVEHLSEVLRLGLIGGGMEPIRALKIVRRYVEERPPMESFLFAQAVLAVGLLGAPDEDVKKKQKTASRSTPSRTASSGSSQSTDQQPS